MADSVAAGLGDENDTENEDKEREKQLISKTKKHIGASDVTETLGFYERKAKCQERKSNVSGMSDRQPLCLLQKQVVSHNIELST